MNCPNTGKNPTNTPASRLITIISSTTGATTRFASKELMDITLKYQAMRGKTASCAPKVTPKESAI